MRLPMYEVRSTMYDLGSSRAERASVAKPVRRRDFCATDGRSEKAAMAAGAAYVRRTVYDLGSSRAKRAILAPMYDL